MSAAAAAPGTATGNALSGGGAAAPEKVATKARKRTTVSRGTSEGTDVVPPLTTTSAVTRARRAREPKMTLEEGMAFSRDLSVVDEETEKHEHNNHNHNNNTPLSTPTQKKHALVVDIASGRASPVKHKTTVKSVTHKAKKRSIWDTMSHLFSPMFLFFIVGAGLGTTVWNMRPRPVAPQWDVSSAEVEKLEEFVTKTTKWMQVQLEVLDMKIDKQKNEIRDEFKQKLDSQVAGIASGVKGLKSQLDHLYENGVPLNRNEVMELVKNVVEQRASESSSKSFSLEDVRSIARKIVLSEVEKHAADGIGRADYALASGGGRVVDHSEGLFLGRNRQWSTLAFSSILPGATRRHPLAQKVLEPSFGEPGQCLPLKGSNVYVDISLRTSIRPDAVTLEHVSKSVAYDLSSAPKEFQLYGWREMRPADRIAQPSAVHRLLGQFVYNTDGSSIQTFHLSEDDEGGELINMVRLHVLTNHGSPLHTCIYRIRIHGSDPQATL